MPGMTTADNERWRERVRKEDQIMSKQTPNPYRLNANTLWAAPVEPHRLDPRMASAAGTKAAFKRYDTNNDGSMDAREIKSLLKDLQVTLSEANLEKLKLEMDRNGDGKVSVKEIAEWWSNKEKEMSAALFTDPTTKWGSSPAITSREVGWFVARQAEMGKVRKASAAKWRVPKQSCAETLYSTEYVKFAGVSPYSNKGREEK